MKTLQELTAIKEDMRKEMALRLGKEADGAKYRKHVLMCGGTGCTSSGSMKIADELENQLKAKGIDNEIFVVRTGCFGLCERGPIMIVYPEGSFYTHVKMERSTESLMSTSSAASRSRSSSMTRPSARILMRSSL